MWSPSREARTAEAAEAALVLLLHAMAPGGGGQGGGGQGGGGQGGGGQGGRGQGGSSKGKRGSQGGGGKGGGGGGASTAFCRVAHLMRRLASALRAGSDAPQHDAARELLADVHASFWAHLFTKRAAVPRRPAFGTEQPAACPASCDDAKEAAEAEEAARAEAELAAQLASLPPGVQELVFADLVADAAGHLAWAPGDRGRAVVVKCMLFL